MMHLEALDILIYLYFNVYKIESEKLELGQRALKVGSLTPYYD